MRNFVGAEAALTRAYIDAESNDSEGIIPDNPELAEMTRVKAINEVVDVDLYIPGCPPNADVIFYALSELAQGRIPEIKDDMLHWH